MSPSGAACLYAQEKPDELPQIRELRMVCSYAFAIAEQNADNGTIVTAPTCGSAGVLPSVLLYMQKRHNIPDRKVLEALAVAGLFGSLVKRNASISGAECGCQAEIGTACSMAAAALCHLMGKTINETEYAAEIAMEHHKVSEVIRRNLVLYLSMYHKLALSNHHKIAAVIGRINHCLS